MIRALTPADATALADLMTRCSPATRHQRFHGVVTAIPPAYLASCLNGEHDTLVAVVGGVSRPARVPGGKADGATSEAGSNADSAAGNETGNAAGSETDVPGSTADGVVDVAGSAACRAAVGETGVAGSEADRVADGAAGEEIGVVGGPASMLGSTAGGAASMPGDTAGSTASGEPDGRASGTADTANSAASDMASSTAGSTASDMAGSTAENVPGSTAGDTAGGLAGGAAGGEIVGMASMGPVFGEPAVHEVAVLVEDRWQGKGIGRALVSALFARAVVKTVRMELCRSPLLDHLVATLPVVRSQQFGCDVTIDVDVLAVRRAARVPAPRPPSSAGRRPVAAVPT